MFMVCASTIIAMETWITGVFVISITMMSDLCGANGQDVVKPNEVTDMCDLDPYTLQCGREQVIQIIMALYGRMSANHCTGSNYLGCSSDALGLADSWCSGHQMCFIDESFHTHLGNTYHNCSRDIRKYLQISYKCVNVVTPPSARCSSSGAPAATLHDAEGYLSSHMARKFMCNNVPWVIRAPPNHVIRIQLFDFTWFLDNPPCDVKYAEIFDVDAKTTTSVCRLKERRHKPVDFKTSALKIKILWTSEGMDFLIHYKVFSTKAGVTGALSQSGAGRLFTNPVLVLLSLLCLALHLNVHRWR